MAGEMDDVPRGAEPQQLKQGEEEGCAGDLMMLSVPEDLPVDLRGKLGVCLIHTDQEPPEVCVYVCLCVCVCVCVCVWVWVCVCVCGHNYGFLYVWMEADS